MSVSLSESDCLFVSVCLHVSLFAVSLFARLWVFLFVSLIVCL